MVAQDKARVRMMVNAALTREDLDFALSAFEKNRQKLAAETCDNLRIRF